MRYDIQLGFLATDAITEFSKASSTQNAGRYKAFLDKTGEYCQAFRKTYGHPVETDIPAAMQRDLADFMRTVVKTQQPSPAIAAKLEAVGDDEGLLRAIAHDQRPPSDEECLRIAKTIYATSGADPS
jgi:hypothetical protein